MTRSQKHIIGTTATVGVLIFCALLPVGLSRLRDFRQLDAIHTAEIEPVVLGRDGTYTLPERIRLLSSRYAYEDAQTMVFHTGVNYTHKSARQNAREQMNAMQRAGLLPESAEAYGEVFVSGVEFTADSADPACNLMTWEICALSEKYLVTLEMDDETGKILAYHVMDMEADGTWSGQADLESIAQAWAGYLGLVLAQEESAQQGGVLMQREEAVPEADGRSERIVLEEDGKQIAYQIYADSMDFGIRIE